MALNWLGGMLRGSLLCFGFDGLCGEFAIPMGVCTCDLPFVVILAYLSSKTVRPAEVTLFVQAKPYLDMDLAKRAAALTVHSGRAARPE